MTSVRVRSQETTHALLGAVGRLAALAVGDPDAGAVRDALAGELLAVCGGTEVRVYDLTDGRTTSHLVGARARIVDDAARCAWPTIVAEVARRGTILTPHDRSGACAADAIARQTPGAGRELAVAPLLEGESSRTGVGPPGWVLAFPLDEGEDEGGDVAAVLILIGPPRGAERLEAVRVLIQQAQAALAVARARTAAGTDPLTGTMNRRAVLGRLAEEIARAQREHGRLGCLFVDLDRFKQVNDRHGHRVGDAILRTVGTALEREFRAFDRVARLGGDEFVVLLPGADPDRALRAADRALGRLTLLTRPGGDALSASIGAACWRPPMSPLDLVHEADGAMLIAKRGGGGRVASPAGVSTVG